MKLTHTLSTIALTSLLVAQSPFVSATSVEEQETAPTPAPTDYGVIDTSNSMESSEDILIIPEEGDDAIVTEEEIAEENTEEEMTEETTDEEMTEENTEEESTSTGSVIEEDGAETELISTEASSATKVVAIIATSTLILPAIAVMFAGWF